MADQLRTLWQRSGLPLKKLFNTAGQSYRNGGFKDRLPKLSESEALDALAADGKLIKRPLFDAGKHVFVGFRETEWAEVIPPEAKTL
jgi:arsenate reductase